MSVRERERGQTKKEQQAGGNIMRQSVLTMTRLFLFHTEWWPSPSPPLGLSCGGGGCIDKRESMGPRSRNNNNSSLSPCQRRRRRRRCVFGSHKKKKKMRTCAYSTTHCWLYFAIASRPPSFLALPRFFLFFLSSSSSSPSRALSR